MIFWVVVFLLALVCVGLVAWPLAIVDSSVDASTPPAETLKARLAGIEQDRAAGLIDEASAEEAVLEEKKQALAAAGDEKTYAPARGWRIAALFALGATPLAAVVIYLNIGAPASLRGGGAAAPSSAASVQPSAIADAQLQTLEARAQNLPDDFDAWMALGQAYTLSNRAGDAARAFAQALAIDADNPDAHSAYGEALVMQASGAVTAEARKAFETTIKSKPEDARARYYLAEARYQVGAIEEAVRQWAALVNDAPENAPWLAAVGARMVDAAGEIGLNIGSVGLTDDAGQRLAAVMNGRGQSLDDELSALISRIHSGEAAYQDWLRAASIYMDRGEIDRASDMLDQAADRYQNAPFVLAQINAVRTSLESGGPIAPITQPADEASAVRGPTEDQAAAISAMSEEEQNAMIASMVDGLAERLKREPGDIQGWRMLARSYSVLDRREDGVAAYRELIKRPEANVQDWRNYAFALLAMRPEGDNTVNDELASVLNKLQEFDANDPLALYHLGFAARQRGEAALAVERWRKLLANLSDDVPMRATLERLIKETENS
ncbi:MAG: c-type cytochrome biogenesis protein CcmI [Parvularculaceae bacterium]